MMIANKPASIITDSLNPSAPQIRAANPENHVWVRASAGSGKTKVLVDRVLRLMLPDPISKKAGTPPEKILCITYTKAGATNIALLIQKILLSWSVMEPKALEDALVKLFNRPIDEDMIKAAKQLFAKILDSPDRLKMMTIHSFCQSVLARFPLETDLSPSMQVIEDFEAKLLLQKAFDAIITNRDELSARARETLFKIPYDRLKSIISVLLKTPSYFKEEKPQERIDETYCKAYGINIAELDTNLQSFVTLSQKDDYAWQEGITGFRAMKTEASEAHADQLDFFRQARPEYKIKNLDEYIKTLTKKPTHKALKSDPIFMDHWQSIQDQYERFLKIEEIKQSTAIFELSTLIYKQYQQLKALNNQLDYNDLIHKTKRLLESSFSWVHYKLDGGIDHILLDESQDTSPEQWDIIRALTSEMLSVKKDEDERRRSLFVVGDEKQSIFSFQGADPVIFEKMLNYFKEKIRPIQDDLEEKLFYSFRSAEPVLNMVDEVFSPPDLKRALGLKAEEDLLHRSYRKDYQSYDKGSVELWLETSEAVKADKSNRGDMYSWVNPIDITRINHSESAEKKLLNKITMRIKQEIQEGHWLPEDILILFRSRNDMMNNLIKMLKWNNIPVSGMDRLILNDHIVIQDIIALAKFITVREDDFSLACFLKSPFIGMNEDDLFTLVTSRTAGQTLMDTLENNSVYEPISLWLKTLIEMASRVPVYELLMHMLIAPCPADPEGSGYKACTSRFGHEIMDPLDEIVGDALRLELQDIRTLPDFITRFSKGQRDIKRELSEAMGEVRIMTVHASKGLEAPVVILADTITIPDHKKTGRVFFDPQTKLPLINAQSNGRSSLINDLRDNALKKQLDEEKRLLYVAMTRAEDTLIIAGAYKATEKNPTPKEQSWYSVVENGFNRMGIAVTERGIRRFGQSFSRHQDKQKSSAADNKGVTQAETMYTPPAWLHTSPPPIPKGQAILNPSLAKRDQAKDKTGFDPVFEPHKPDHKTRFLRGNITHRLLQILPDIASDKQETVARLYVARHRFALSAAIQEDIIKETIAILHDPQFANVFGKNSLAEVPIMGHLPSGDYVSGQIDRLYIGADEILIVDYKTNRPSPDDHTAIPESYRAQLALYKALLALIYPQHHIKTALLWTDKTKLMPILV